MIFEKLNTSPNCTPHITQKSVTQFHLSLIKLRPTTVRVAEIRYTCSESLYKTGVRQQKLSRAVDRRAGVLMGEYQERADTMDSLLGDEVGRGRMIVYMKTHNTNF